MATENNVFSKKHDEVMAQDKRAILEEMNLPPAMVTFLRKYSKNIKIVIGIFVVGIISWEGYGEYSHRQQEKASSVLFSAVNEEDNEEKTRMLQGLVKDFSGSKSALWATIEIGHIAFKEKNYQDAVDKYKQALKEIDKDNSLYPLVQFSIAQAYDGLKDSDKSVEAYKKLLDYTGFAAEGYLGLGRLYENKGEGEKALEMYESYVSLPDLEPGPAKEMVEYKINRLKELKDGK